MDNFIEEQRVVNVQADQEIDIVESSLNKELDEFQSEIDEDFDILQQVQEELMQEPVEAPEGLPVEEAGGGRGKEIVEEPQELVLNPFPTNNPLPVAPSTDQVYILPTPEAYPTPETPSPNATPFALPWLHNFRKLVAIAQTFATTS